MATDTDNQPAGVYPSMAKAIQDFLFGLFFGMGFCIASAVLHFIGSLIGGAGHPIIP